MSPMMSLMMSLYEFNTSSCHSVSQYFDFFDRFHCQNYLLDLVRVLTQPCNHSVIFVQINPGVVRCVVNPLGWNDISLQNVVRAVSGL